MSSLGEGLAAAPRRRLSGLLPVRKPRGMVSKDVSRVLARILGPVRMGHVGTLDPMAEGVLPLLLGSATRLQDYLVRRPKEYEFSVEFGKETDTLDCDGTVTRTCDTDQVTLESLKAVLPEFVGRISQVPPLYSAVKFQGQELYKYARRKDDGASVPLDKLTREVEILSFDLLGLDGVVGRFRVRCGSGAYIRSLARDVAARVGTCGTVVALTRTEAAGVPLSQTVPLDDLVADPARIVESLLPVESLPTGLRHWRAMHDGLTQRLLRGQRLTLASQLWDEPRESVGSPALPPTAVTRPSGRGEEIMLLDSQGVAFGLGMAHHREDYVVISLKRGWN